MSDLISAGHDDDINQSWRSLLEPHSWEAAQRLIQPIARLHELQGHLSTHPQDEVAKESMQRNLREVAEIELPRYEAAARGFGRHGAPVPPGLAAIVAGLSLAASPRLSPDATTYAGVQADVRLLADLMAGLPFPDYVWNPGAPPTLISEPNSPTAMEPSPYGTSRPAYPA